MSLISESSFEGLCSDFFFLASVAARIGDALSDTAHVGSTLITASRASDPLVDVLGMP